LLHDGLGKEGEEGVFGTADGVVGEFCMMCIVGGNKPFGGKVDGFEPCSGSDEGKVDGIGW